MTAPVASSLGDVTPPRGWARSEHLWFLAVGAYNTAFGYAVFAAVHLLFADLNYLVVLLVAHVCSVLNAFVAYRLLVFRVRGSVLRDLFRFWLVYLVSLALNALALPLLVEWVGLDVLVAQAAVVFVTALSSYVGHKRFSFRRPSPSTEPARERA